MAKETEHSKMAKKHLANAGIDFKDLSPENAAKCDTYFRNVIKDWKSGKIDDLTAYYIGGIFETEPIHHLMDVSIYTLVDIWHHKEKGDLEEYKKNLKLKN